jgi:Concanavalin A-like lectin/glucanases superfamily
VANGLRTGKETHMKILRTLVATVVSVCALTQLCDAAQMALRLGGDPESYFEVPDHPSLAKDLGSALTVEAWVNPAVNTTDGTFENCHMILNKEDSYEIAVYNGDPSTEGTFRAAVKPFDTQAWDWRDSTETVPVNKWTHVAMTWDGTTTRTFVNGKFFQAYDDAAADGGKAVVNSTDATLKVGRRVRGDDMHCIFTGLIDEIRISKVIRYTEAGYAVPGKAFAPDADTVALYHFDEAVDGVVKDFSPLGNHGKLIKDAKLVAVDNGPISDTP